MSFSDQKSTNKSDEQKKFDEYRADLLKKEKAHRDRQIAYRDDAVRRSDREAQKFYNDWLKR